MVMASEQLIQKYTRLAETKPGVSRVGWLDKLQQDVQFEVLLDLDVAADASVLDAGCGVGDLLAFLTERNFSGRYTGVDLLPAFVSEANSRFANRPHTCFILGDILTLSLPPHEFVFASGLFDYKTDYSFKRWEQIIIHLNGIARLALAWNGYSQLPANREDMWGVDLTHVAALCQRLSPFWRLRADYAPGHFTVVIFKPEYWFTPALQTLIGHLFLDRSLTEKLRRDPQTFASRYGLTMQQLNLLDPLLTIR
jgi:SAM-dependent methyltransferase